MTYLSFTEMVQSCNWNPFSEVFLEYWVPDEHGGSKCVRVLVTNIRFESGEVIIAGPAPIS